MAEVGDDVYALRLSHSLHGPEVAGRPVGHGGHPARPERRCQQRLLLGGGHASHGVDPLSHRDPVVTTQSILHLADSQPQLQGLLGAHQAVLAPGQAVQSVDGGGHGGPIVSAPCDIPAGLVTSPRPGRAPETKPDGVVSEGGQGRGR